MFIGYARVSTDEQSIDLQVDALERAGCHRIFRDCGFSGALKSRPALDEALASLQSGDTLVTWRLDRLGRSLSHLISLVNDLETRGIAFESLSEAIDTSTAGGRLQFHMMGALAEFERALISERTKAGMAAARLRECSSGAPINDEHSDHEEEFALSHKRKSAPSTPQLRRSRHSLPLFDGDRSKMLHG